MDIKFKRLVMVGAVVLVAFIGIGYYTFQIMMEDKIVKNIIKNSQEEVKRLQIVREYYTKYVVKDIKKNAPDIQLDFNHKNIDYNIPYPTTVIHDLTKMYSQRSDVTFKLYSEYPFLNRKDRILTPFQKEAIKMVEKSEDGIYVKKDTLKGQKVLRVAIADYMILPACVNCHNSHPLKNWPDNKWKLGDKRGIIEIITPLN